MIARIFNWPVGLLGFASWLVPFAVSFFFYDGAGLLAVDILLFKSLMVVIGGLAGAVLLVVAFRLVVPTFASGLMLGLFWLVINWGLDLVVLVGALGMDAGAWFTGISLRYLMIPIMAAAIGVVAARQVR